jgi:hypothetical protein
MTSPSHGRRPRREAIVRRLSLPPNMVRSHTTKLQAGLGVHSEVAAMAVMLETVLRPGCRRLER